MVTSTKTIFVEAMGETKRGTILRQIGDCHVEFTLDDYPGFTYTAPIRDVRLSIADTQTRQGDCLECVSEKRRLQARDTILWLRRKMKLEPADAEGKGE